jgi:hypothetical protein
MLDILPVEIQELIFNYLPFETGRSLNKHYQEIVNKIETRNLSPVIITKSIVNKYLDKRPSVIMFTIINSATGTSTRRSVKVTEEVYINDFCKIGECKCEYVYQTNLAEIKEKLNKLEYDYFFLDKNLNMSKARFFLDKNLKMSKATFLPHYSFIKYAVKTHPLAKINYTYRNSKIRATIKYYYDKLLPYSFLLEIFTSWTSRALDIKENVDDPKLLMEKIYEKLL